MRAIWGLVLLCLVGCNATPSNNGEACDEIANEIADVAGHCNISGYDRTTLVTAVNTGCCAQTGRCGKPLVHVEQFFRCKREIPGMSCLEVTGQELPNDCIGLIE